MNKQHRLKMQELLNMNEKEFFETAVECGEFIPNMTTHLFRLLSEVNNIINELDEIESKINETQSKVRIIQDKLKQIYHIFNRLPSDYVTIGHWVSVVKSERDLRNRCEYLEEVLARYKEEEKKKKGVEGK